MTETVYANDSFRAVFFVTVKAQKTRRLNPLLTRGECSTSRAGFCFAKQGGLGYGRKQREENA